MGEYHSLVYALGKDFSVFRIYIDGEAKQIPLRFPRYI
jgi:hypothetical protein